MQRQMDTNTLEGFTFFHGYGDETESRWAKFRELLNAQADGLEDKEIIIRAADETFEKFKCWIEKNPL